MPISCGDVDSRRRHAAREKPRNLKGFKSQGMVVCAVEALGEGKVGAGCDTESPPGSHFLLNSSLQPHSDCSIKARL